MRHFAGTAAMVRLVLRRDRVRLPVWIVAILATVFVTVNAVRGAYGTPELIQSYAMSVGGSPTAVAMAGPPFALDTISGILVYETSILALLAVAMMSIFLTIRHTRGDEDEGRTELLRSTVVGRYAHNAAALLVLTVANLVVGAGIVLAMLSIEGVPVLGSLLYGTSIAIFGVVFAGVASVVAQVMSHRRTATGVSISLLGLAFGVRAIGDIGDGTLSWFSPMGWSQQVGAFELDRWWPLAPSLVLSVALIGLAALLIDRRDLGAGMVSPRPGPATASRLLSGPVGLALRLQRGSIIGWAAGLFVFGMVMGSFSQELVEMVESNPTVAEFLAAAGGGSIVDSYFAVMLLIIAVIVSAFTVGSALRVRGEEIAGRMESLLATPVSRQRWLFGGLLVTLLGTTVVLVAGGLGVSIAHAAVSDDPGVIGPLVGNALVYLPAILVLGALAVLLTGLAPRWAMAVWAVVAYCFVLGYLGGLLDPPQWVMNLSPFTHTPQVPVAPVSATPLLWLVGAVVVGAALGAVGLRRRDLTT